MAEVTFSAGVLRVRLGRWERTLGMLKDLDVPRSAIVSARAEPDPLHITGGIRAPGLGVPGVARIGTYRGEGWRDYVVARSNQPGIVIEVAPAITGYRRLVLSTPAAADLVAALSR